MCSPKTQQTEAPRYCSTAGLLFCGDQCLPALNHPPSHLQRRRPPPAAETGRSCWGRGQQDASDSEADAGSRNPGSAIYVTPAATDSINEKILFIRNHLPSKWNGVVRTAIRLYHSFRQKNRTSFSTITCSFVLKSHPEWRPLHHPCSSGAARGRRPA